MSNTRTSMNIMNDDRSTLTVRLHQNFEPRISHALEHDLIPSVAGELYQTKLSTWPSPKMQQPCLSSSSTMVWLSRIP